MAIFIDLGLDSIENLSQSLVIHVLEDNATTPPPGGGGGDPGGGGGGGDPGGGGGGDPGGGGGNPPPTSGSIFTPGNLFTGMQPSPVGQNVQAQMYNDMMYLAYAPPGENYILTAVNGGPGPLRIQAPSSLGLVPNNFLGSDFNNIQRVTAVMASEENGIQNWEVSIDPGHENVHLTIFIPGVNPTGITMNQGYPTDYNPVYLNLIQGRLLRNMQYGANSAHRLEHQTLDAGMVDHDQILNWFARVLTPGGTEPGVFAPNGFIEPRHFNTLGYGGINYFQCPGYRHWCRMATQAGCPGIWICPTHNVTDAFIAEIATIIEAEFPVGTVVFEMGNEVWNKAPPYLEGHHYYSNLTITHPDALPIHQIPTPVDEFYSRALVGHWLETRRIGLMFKNMFADPSRVLICQPFGLPNLYHYDNDIIPYYDASHIDVLAVAPYFGNTAAARSLFTDPNATTTQIAEAMQASLVDPEFVESVVGWNARAAALNIPLLGYECWHHLIPQTVTINGVPTLDFEARWKGILQEPAYTQLVSDFLDYWRSFSHTSVLVTYSQFTEPTGGAFGPTSEMFGLSYACVGNSNNEFVPPASAVRWLSETI